MPLSAALPGAKRASARTIDSFFEKQPSSKRPKGDDNVIQAAGGQQASTALSDETAGLPLSGTVPAAEFQASVSAPWDDLPLPMLPEQQQKQQQGQKPANPAGRKDAFAQLMNGSVRRPLQPQLTKEELEQLAASNMSAAEAAALSSPLPALSSLLTEASWREALVPEFSKPYMSTLQQFVHGEWGRNMQVFPPKACVFRAFNSCPLSQVRVVILGQDPYHDDGQAMGLSFSVPRGKAVPPSLRNMYKELAQDVPGCVAQPGHGDLTKWAHQGVLLLNTTLTVRAHAANSHAKQGWERFTDAAIALLSERRSGIVFLLWGKPAQAKARLISAKHHVLQCAHPSPLSASRGFFGCHHFSSANRLLQASGLPPIDWAIDP